jgi:pyrimidine-nucleoside phosphorylase
LNPVELIQTKRDGGVLSEDQIRRLIDAYTRGDIPDYQVSAFLMAAFLRGMDENETAALTRAMLHSGEVLDPSDIPGVKVDKHSTGGVGDKVSLILAPLVAACGVPVPMISGRGLGHTGGTLDKLEAIPGFRTDLSIDDYRRQLGEIGVVMIGQTAEIAPADRKIYALRDVTGTVEFIPFIAASIMSKKLAEGIDALVLDVKSGRGAFMKREEDARRLAETLTGIGLAFGKPTVAHLTAMDAPLGFAVGNWPETAEAIHCLRGEDVDDLMEVTYALAGEMIFLGRAASSPAEGREKARRALESGHALEKLIELVAAQGGDVSVIENPRAREGNDPVAEVLAPDDARGFVTGIDALAIGHASVGLGAGRLRKEDEVDPTAGFVFAKKPGDPVDPGEVLLRVYGRHPERLDHDRVVGAFSFGPEPPASRPMLLDRYDGRRWAQADSEGSGAGRNA